MNEYVSGKCTAELPYVTVGRCSFRRADGAPRMPGEEADARPSHIRVLGGLLMQAQIRTR